MKSKQKEVNIFVMAFNVEPAEAPDSLQRYITEPQTNNKLKARYNKLPVLEFYDLHFLALKRPGSFSVYVWHKQLLFSSTNSRARPKENPSSCGPFEVSVIHGMCLQR